MFKQLLEPSKPVTAGRTVHAVPCYYDANSPHEHTSVTRRPRVAAAAPRVAPVLRETAQHMQGPLSVTSMHHRVPYSEP